MNAQAIQTAEILVRFANPAEDGKKPNIRTPDGTTYGVKPVDFGRFQPGRRYRIEYIEKEGRGKWQGRIFRDIVKCEPVTSGDARGARAPSPSVPGEGAIPGEADFVSRCLAASIASCAVGRSREDLIERARTLREVYREVF